MKRSLGKYVPLNILPDKVACLMEDGLSEFWIYSHGCGAWIAMVSLRHHISDKLLAHFCANQIPRNIHVEPHGALLLTITPSTIFTPPRSPVTISRSGLPTLKSCTNRDASGLSAMGPSRRRAPETRTQGLGFYTPPPPVYEGRLGPP